MHLGRGQGNDIICQSLWFSLGQVNEKILQIYEKYNVDLLAKKCCFQIMFPHMEVQLAMDALVNNGFKPFFMAYEEREELSSVVPYCSAPDEDCLWLLNKIREEGRNWNVIGYTEILREHRY